MIAHSLNSDVDDLIRVHHPHNSAFNLSYACPASYCCIVSNVMKTLVGNIGSNDATFLRPSCKSLNKHNAFIRHLSIHSMIQTS